MILFDFTMLLICCGTGVLGGLAGVVGSWLFLQRKSLFGDTIAHATLPGLTGIFLLTHIKHSGLLLLGGLCSALVAAYLIHVIQQHCTLKKDTILGVILASSFGLGTIFLSKIQTLPNAHQAGLTKYLLGNPATMLLEDLIMIIIATIITLLITMRYIKPYAIVLFDTTYATTIGISINKVSWIMLTAITITIVFGLQAVGIILMSALLINPAAAAYQWTKNFNKMMLLSALFGSSSTVIGTLLSCTTAHLPTGPVIVIIATMITSVSILCSPCGVIISWYKHKKQIKTINHISFLSHFYLFNEGKQDPFHAHNIAALEAIGKPFTQQTLQFLSKHGLIDSPRKNFWRLTPKGVAFLTQKTDQSKL